MLKVDGRSRDRNCVVKFKTREDGAQNRSVCAGDFCLLFNFLRRINSSKNGSTVI